MAEEFHPQAFTIVSYTEGNPPVGVNHSFALAQNVFVNAPLHHWTAHKVGKTTYHLSVGGYRFVGVEDGKVHASGDHLHETLWKITHHRPQNAYTIELADKPDHGWTIPGDEAGHKDIVIAPFLKTRSSPPLYFANQLFLLKNGHHLGDE